MTVVWIVVGIVVGWTVVSWFTGIASPWRSLWRWMRGHPIKASVVVVAIVLIVGQLAFGWLVKQSRDAVPPCEGERYGAD